MTNFLASLFVTGESKFGNRKTGIGKYHCRPAPNSELWDMTTLVEGYLFHAVILNH